MTKFFEEFTAKSNGAFPELKFNSATYYKDKHALDVRFIISAFDSKLYDDKKKASMSNFKTSSSKSPLVTSLVNSIKV